MSRRFVVRALPAVPTFLLLPMLLVAVLLQGCSTGSPYAYSPEALRQAVQDRVPGISPDDIVVIHQVSPEAVERARELVPNSRPGDRLRSLLESLSDPEGFGLRYRWAKTADANRTLELGEGNCLGLASVMVGLARSLGFHAYYADASRNTTELREEGEIRVRAGHIAVVIHVPEGAKLIDFSGEVTSDSHIRIIDDLEAVAHFYNNRGYERIHIAQVNGEAIPWQEIRADFELATQIKPNMARAWNNLGVALGRLGDERGAEHALLRAMEMDPRLESARSNLRETAARAD